MDVPERGSPETTTTSFEIGGSERADAAKATGRGGGPADES